MAADRVPRLGRIRRWRPSIRLRVTVVAAAVVGLVLVTGGVVLSGYLRSALLRSASDAAVERAAQVTAMAGRAPLPGVLPAVGSPHRTYIQVVDHTGRLVSSSASLAHRPVLVRIRPAHRVVGPQAALGHGQWIAQPLSTTVGGRRMTVVVYTSAADIDRTMNLLDRWMTLGLPVAVLFVALVVWVVTGRALRPVEAMRREASAITALSLSRRVPEPHARDEIARLASTLNQMLDRLEAADDRQRRFTADASHELRTPLANLRTALEVALAHPEQADWPQVAADAVAQSERMERLTADLLQLAAADAGRAVVAPEPVDLAELVRAELRRPTVEGISFEADGVIERTVVLGDRDRLQRALTNLVDNARRHARGHVTVGLLSAGSAGVLWVTDDGPGVAAEDRTRVFDRFVRLDGHRDRNQGGTGLGLAITREIVVAHGGEIGVSDAAAGPGTGATFQLRLPLAPPPGPGEEGGSDAMLMSSGHRDPEGVAPG
ncbi:MAG TPA: ATP-binding protein [Acidimicrobiales bacterium]